MVIDGFGNVQLDARPGDLGRAPRPPVDVGDEGPRARYLRTFADAEPGELLLYEDAAGMLALAVNGGEAAAELGGLAPGDEVRLKPLVSALGRPRLHLREIDSTNERARELAAAGAPHGTLVTAAAQTAGRGRQGRRWEAPRGIGAAVLAGACATSTRCCRCAPGWRWPTWPGEPARVKWPNDVLVDGRKVAGVLVEGRPQDGWAVVGIGVNVAAAPRGRAARAGTLGRADVEEVAGGAARRAGAAASASLPRRRWTPCGRATRCSARRCRGTAGAGVGDGIDAGRRVAGAAADGGVTVLSAGEVHLGRR